MTNPYCLNCGKALNGNYCSHCGQKATVARLTWKNLVNELVHFFTHAEHSFVYTSKQVIRDPGMVMKDFLDGKRQRIHKPVTFLLLWAAIDRILVSFYAYCTQHFNLYVFADTTPALRILWRGPRNPAVVANETWITLLFQAPILVLLGWLIFRKTKTSFVERWVIIIYGLSATMILSVTLRTITFLLRLSEAPITRGNFNDAYFLSYQLLNTWIVYSFLKVFRSGIPPITRFVFAFLVGLLANYISDIAFYLVYRLSA